MDSIPFEIDYYETDAGKRPFKEWLEGMKDVNGRAKIRIRLDRARLGNLGDHKHIGAGMWEFRIDYGPGYRVYYGKEGNRLLLLLIGGDKSSQSRDIEQAQGYWQDHLGRKGHGTSDKLPG
jgi:putative addiction module killer protein